MQREIEVLHHTLDHGYLLPILLSEIGALRSDDLEKLEYDGSYAAKVAGAARAFGLFSQRISYDEFSSMFHGDNERVDQESLRLSTELWDATARDLLSD